MKRLTLVSDPLTFVGGIVITIHVPVSWIITAYAAYFGHSPVQNAFEFVIVSLSLLFIAFGMCIIIKYIPAWTSRIVLDSNGIQLRAGKNSTAVIPYDNYRFIRVAFYMHMGAPRFFLVISDQHIPEEILYDVRQLGNDASHVKIQLTRRRIRKLYSILPENKKKVLDTIMGPAGYIDSHNNPVVSAMSRKERMEKQKRRKKSRRKKR